MGWDELSLGRPCGLRNLPDRDCNLLCRPQRPPEEDPHDRANTLLGRRGAEVGIPPPRLGQRRVRPDLGGSPPDVGYNTALDADTQAGGLES